MKLISLAAAAVMVAGCAAGPDPIEAPQLSEAASAGGTSAAEDIEVAAVVELEPASAQAANVEPCRRSLVTGTRITRVQCEKDIPESQRLLNEEFVRSELEYAREMAMIEEMRRADEAAEAAMRRMEMSGPR